MFNLIITLAMVLLWGTTAFISVQGLVSFLPGAGVVIYALGMGLELGKLLVIMHLHAVWDRSGFLKRGYYCGVIAILVALTACEVVGYLSQGHQGATVDHRATTERLTMIRQEKALLADQLKTIDATLAGLPKGFVTRRIKVRESMGYDDKSERLLALSRQEADLAVSAVSQVKEKGPVYAVAGLFGIEAERAATGFICVLVAVMELLTIGLAVAVAGVWLTGGKSEPAMADLRVDSIEVYSGVEPAGQDIPAEPVQPFWHGESVSEPGSFGVQAESVENRDADSAVDIETVIDRYGLTHELIAKITGKAQVETVKNWFRPDGKIPDKARRQIFAYVRDNPVRLVAEG